MLIASFVIRKKFLFWESAETAQSAKTTVSLKKCNQTENADYADCAAWLNKNNFRVMPTSELLRL